MEEVTELTPNVLLQANYGRQADAQMDKKPYRGYM